MGGPAGGSGRLRDPRLVCLRQMEKKRVAAIRLALTSKVPVMTRLSVAAGSMAAAEAQVARSP